jgi:predicted Zn-dependent protease
MLHPLFLVFLLAPRSGAAPCDPSSPASVIHSDLSTASDAIERASEPDEAESRPFREDIVQAVGDRIADDPGRLDELIALLPEVLVEAAQQREGPAIQRAVETLTSLGEELWTELDAELPLSLEVADSRRFRDEFLFPEDNPPELTARGQGLLDRIEEASPGGLELRMNVLDDSGFQAFAKGGENMYISSGAFGMPEDELAAAVAHERVHLLERHLPQTLSTRALGRELKARVAESSVPAAELVARITEARMQHRQEFQADARGADMLEASGFDPGAMTRLIERTASSAPAGLGMGDHPSIEARIQALQGR